MNQDDFRLFLHLSGTLHFARSAGALHMSPSALTRALQRLEEEVGQVLIARDRHHAALTPAGERFRRYARDQLSAWEALQEELSEEQRSPSGDLRIACTLTACYSLLPRLIARCRRAYPRIHIALSTQDAVRSMGQLQSGEVDVAVVPLDDATPSELRRQTLGHTELVFIAPRDATPFGEQLSCGEITWRDVPIVAPQRGLDRARLELWLSGLPERPPIAAEVRGNEAIIALVSMGCGVGLVPQLVLEQSPHRRRVRRISAWDTPSGYDVGLCVSAYSLQVRTVRAFWELAGGAL